MISPPEALLALSRGHDASGWSRQLRDSWESFVTEHSFPEDGAVRPFILDRWKAARERGIDPLLSAVPLAAETEEIERILSVDAFALAGRRTLDNVAGSVAAEGHVLMLTDAEGRILHTTGNRRLLEDLHSVNARPGGIWDETFAGPNGIGGVLTSLKPVVVFGPEHFCERWHKWFCFGAPVQDPLTGELLGVVDITGATERLTGNQYPLVLSLAHAIEYQLGEPRLAERHYLTEAFRRTLGRYPHEPLAAFDRTGRLLESTDHWRELAADSEISSLCSRALANVTGRASSDPEIRIDLCSSNARSVVIWPVRSMDRFAGAIARLERRSMPRAYTTDLPHTFATFVGCDPEFRKALKIAAKAAACDEPVLITGETGTGKELVARAIHESSARSRGPLVCVNCAALPRDLAESELFGYQGGAFTGARREGKPGRFELANEGTLFLDELGELPVDVQAKLLRVLEERAVLRVGGIQPHNIDVRVIAATNRNLFRGVAAGEFRRDLFYRLAVIEVDLPPLRARGSDVLKLAQVFLETACRQANRPRLRLSREAEECLLRYSWPGNVRELRNVAARLATLMDSDQVGTEDLPATLRGSVPQLPASTDGSLHTAKEDLIRRALDTTGGNLSAAARQLGVDRSTIYRVLRRRRSVPPRTAE